MDLLQSWVPALPDILTAPLMATIESRCFWHRYSPGQLVHRRGDRDNSFSIIRSGSLQSSNVGLDGSTVTTSVLGPGQCFGEFTLFAGLPRTHDVYAHTAAEVGNIPGREFERLITEHPEIVRALLTISLRRSYGLLEFLDSMRRLPLDVRVAKVLLGQVQQGGDSRIDCTQEGLAFTLGVSRISVSKVLARLEAEGLLLRGYRYLDISDPDALREWVQERDLVVSLSSY